MDARHVSPCLGFQIDYEAKAVPQSLVILTRSNGTTQNRSVPRTTTNGIEIEYETLGDSAGTPLLLISGGGGQMTTWQDDFCHLLVDRGHFVIRFDNRDIGLSAHFDHAGIPNIADLIRSFQAGETPKSVYSLEDMADDAIGLLDALAVPAAHICGVSLGGMVAQTMAIKHASRVLGIVSISSTTGNPDLPGPKPTATSALNSSAGTDRDDMLDAAVRSAHGLSGGGFPINEADVRRRAAINFDRSFHPEGGARQAAAVVADGSRVDRLKQLRVRALVIHGTQDPMFPVECGRDTAKSIPGAELVEIEGMGHELPDGAWDQIVEAICALTHASHSLP